MLARPIDGATPPSATPSGRSCGAAATSWETATPAGELHAYQHGSGTDHSVTRYPAMITSARAIEHAGGVLVLEWELEADRRERLRALERRYLRSIRCR